MWSKLWLKYSTQTYVSSSFQLYQKYDRIIIRTALLLVWTNNVRNAKKQIPNTADIIFWLQMARTTKWQCYILEMTIAKGQIYSLPRRATKLPSLPLYNETAAGHPCSAPPAGPSRSSPAWGCGGSAGTASCCSAGTWRWRSAPGSICTAELETVGKTRMCKLQTLLNFLYWEN